MNLHNHGHVPHSGLTPDAASGQSKEMSLVIYLAFLAKVADLYYMILLLHMCFDRFLLAFESRDLSQADKSVFFPKLSDE